MYRRYSSKYLKKEKIISGQLKPHEGINQGFKLFTSTIRQAIKIDTQKPRHNGQNRNSERVGYFSAIQLAS